VGGGPNEPCVAKREGPFEILAHGPAPTLLRHCPQRILVTHFASLGMFLDAHVYGEMWANAPSV